MPTVAHLQRRRRQVNDIRMCEILAKVVYLVSVDLPMHRFRRHLNLDLKILVLNSVQIKYENNLKSRNLQL